jgi:hypothetical protein
LHAEVVHNGAALLGEHGRRRLMQTFYTRVADILGTLAESCSPRTLEERYENLQR